MRNVERLNVTGGAGDDVLSGDALANRLWGGAGVDRLVGGGGADTLDLSAASRIEVRTEGGATVLRVGSQAYDVADVSTVLDRIADFVSGADLIDLKAIDANTTQAGDQAFVLAAAFTGQAGQMTLSFDALTNQTTLSLDVNGDRNADFALLMNGQVTSTEGWVL